MLIAEELALLLVGDDGSLALEEEERRHALGAALLYDVRDGERDAPLVEDAMKAAQGKPGVVEAVEAAAELQGIEDRLLGILAERGLVTIEEQRRLGLFRSKRYRVRNEAVRTQIRERVRAVVLNHDVDGDARTMALIDVLAGADAMQLVLDYEEQGMARVRIAELVDLEGPGAAVAVLGNRTEIGAFGGTPLAATGPAGKESDVDGDPGGGEGGGDGSGE